MHVCTQIGDGTLTDDGVKMLRRPAAALGFYDLRQDTAAPGSEVHGRAKAARALPNRISTHVEGTDQFGLMLPVVPVEGDAERERRAVFSGRGQALVRWRKSVPRGELLHHRCPYTSVDEFRFQFQADGGDWHLSGIAYRRPRAGGNRTVALEVTSAMLIQAVTQP